MEDHVLISAKACLSQLRWQGDITTLIAEFPHHPHQVAPRTRTKLIPIFLVGTFTSLLLLSLSFTLSW